MVLVGCLPGGADQKVKDGHERRSGCRRHERVAREALLDIPSKEQPQARPEAAAEARGGVGTGVLERVGEHHDGGVCGHGGIRGDSRAEEVSAVKDTQQDYFGILSDDLSIFAEPYTMSAGSQPKAQARHIRLKFQKMPNHNSTTNDPARHVTERPIDCGLPSLFARATAATKPIAATT